MLGQPVAESFAVESAEWHGGDMHDEAIAVPHEAIAKDFPCVFQAKMVDGIVQRTHQHQTPKSVDGTFRLVMSKQPVT